MRTICPPRRTFKSTFHPARRYGTCVTTAGVRCGSCWLDKAPPGDLVAETTVTGADGRYQAALSRDWEIGGPNGGYVAAVALRAAGAVTSLSRPVSFAGHFLFFGELRLLDGWSRSHEDHGCQRTVGRPVLGGRRRGDTQLTKSGITANEPAPYLCIPLSSAEAAPRRSSSEQWHGY